MLSPLNYTHHFKFPLKGGTRFVIKYFESRRTCKHWPHKTRVFPKTPWTHSKDIRAPRVDKDQIEVTDLMRKLEDYPNSLTFLLMGIPLKEVNLESAGVAVCVCSAL